MSTQLLPSVTTTKHDPGGKIRLRIPEDWHSEAEFSSCDRYRYKLLRRWSPGPVVLVVGMNPSTADLSVNDLTVNRCCTFAKYWGYGGLYIGNVCAYRSTSPKGLLSIQDPAGPRNLAAILEMAQESALIVIAHGTLPRGLQYYANLTVAVMRASRHKLHYLKLSKLGQPVHPLYLSKELKPVLWL